jgi:hypothetical protein
MSLQANAPAQGWLHARNAQMSLELASLAPGFLPELINERGRRLYRLSAG